MDVKTYSENVLRTTAPADSARANIIAKKDLACLMFNKMQTLVDDEKVFDAFKRVFYYGKPPKTEIEVQQVAEFVDNPLKNISLDQTEMLHCLLGMCTETFELISAVLAYIESGKFDKVNAFEEIGDTMWYISYLVSVLGGDFENILEKNIAKLRARYPDKFDSDKAVTRNLDAERKILE